jgi:glycosyltransferase involved in cell wall biosynthesis
MTRILFLTSGFPPYEFSENIVNGKLVLALLKKGYSVKVISKIDEGKVYNSDWIEPWESLQPHTFLVRYPNGSRLSRFFDILKNVLHFKYPLEGIRWAGYAYEKSVEYIQKGQVDIVITRSPSDIAHLVGLRLKKNYNIKWIANWNDPATAIWPEPYEYSIPFWRKYIYKKFTQEVLSKADYNTFPSKLLSEHFCKYYYVERNKIEIIPHIILPDYNLEIKSVSSTDLHICHSGNLSIERDPENLFIALKQFIEKTKRVIYIDILGVSTSYAVRLVEKYNLKGIVKFVDPLPYYAAIKKMSEYDVLMIIEAKMGESIFLPSKITDYIQLRKPVLSISPLNSELGNLFKRYGGGIIADNNSVDDIYSKLCLLDKLREEDLLNKQVQSSSIYQYMASDYVVDQYKKLFEKENILN